MKVTEFQEERRFRWEGAFLWLGLGYDHLVTTDDTGRVSITFTVDAAGLGVNLIGPLFAGIYARSLNRAIPDCRPSYDHPIRHRPRSGLGLEELIGRSTRLIERSWGGLATAAFGAAGISLAAGAGADRGIPCGERGPVNLTDSGQGHGRFSADDRGAGRSAPVTH